MTDTNIVAAMPPGEPPQNIEPVTIEEEMRRSYLDYAMSVIVSRALPDVRDGLKPVHRRILYAMKEGGYDSTKPYKKSARIVGDVMGKYHPHGDGAIYDAMVRMAQDFSMRLPLVDGQGNFGSMDGDKAAAMRYTEARLAKVSETMLDDIDKDTVNFHPNYDETTLEPDVLPSRVPNLLVNGAGGIAVGMATNIPPHNLGEVIDACLAFVDDRDMTVEQLMEHVPAPDFPTGGIILGRAGIRSAYETGRGSIIMRARIDEDEIELKNGRGVIVVTEIPYQVNKSRLLERIADLVRDKQIEGISDLRDESDREGVRVVIELKRDGNRDVILNQLYRFTPLQTSFGVNMLALNNGKPEQLNLRQVIEAFVDFREEVITRRTEYELSKARDKAHLLVGLAVAVANIDEIIQLIRNAKDPGTARAQLLSRRWPAGDVAPLIRLVAEPGREVEEDGTYQMSEEQAKAILELRLHRLTGLERDKIGNDLQAITDQIAEYLLILTERERLLEVLREELTEVREKFGQSPRRTEQQDAEFEADIEDLIVREEMVVTVSSGGYIKRVPLATYRAQKRGGKGRTGMATKDEDFVSELIIANTHTPMLFFSSTGMVYKTKVYRLPLGSPQSKGKALVNLLPLQQGETITAFMSMPEDESTWDELFVMFATSSGSVRRNSLSDFVRVQANGKIAMKLDDDDKLIGVHTCSENQDVLLATRNGKCIRFSVQDIRVFKGRNSVGVRGVRLLDDDQVISMSILNNVEATSEQRSDYLRLANAKRRDQVAEEGAELEFEAMLEASCLTRELFEAFADKEEFLLAVSEQGYGKRSSAYEYRVSGRGGQGIKNMEMGGRNKHIASTFTVEDDHQVMMVTDAGQMIRMPIHDVRITGRQSMGVTLFRIKDDERIVSVARLREDEEEVDLEDGVETPTSEETAPPETPTEA